MFDRTSFVKVVKCAISSSLWRPLLTHGFLRCDVRCLKFLNMLTYLRVSCEWVLGGRVLWVQVFVQVCRCFSLAFGLMAQILLMNCQWSWKRFVQEEAWTRHDLERGLAPRAFQECCSQQSSFWIRSLQTCRTWAETTAVSSTMCTELTLIEAVFLLCSFLTALGISMLLSFLFSSLALVWRSRYMIWTDILDSCTLGEEVLHPRTSSLCSLQLQIRLWQP